MLSHSIVLPISYSGPCFYSRVSQLFFFTLYFHQPDFSIPNQVQSMTETTFSPFILYSLHSFLYPLPSFFFSCSSFYFLLYFILSFPFLYPFPAFLSLPLFPHFLLSFLFPLLFLLTCFFPFVFHFPCLFCFSLFAPFLYPSFFLLFSSSFYPPFSLFPFLFFVFKLKKLRLYCQDGDEHSDDQNSKSWC